MHFIHAVQKFGFYNVSKVDYSKRKNLAVQDWSAHTQDTVNVFSCSKIFFLIYMERDLVSMVYLSLDQMG